MCSEAPSPPWEYSPIWPGTACGVGPFHCWHREDFPPAEGSTPVDTALTACDSPLA
jgi:hypothetical protein